MKIFKCQQIREIDAATIVNEPISSVDLMERAATTAFRWISGKFSMDTDFYVFAGVGNNGGDGLVIARLLSNGGYRVRVFVIQASSKMSADCSLNLKRLSEETAVTVIMVDDAAQLPEIDEDCVVIDAIFGSGLSRPVTGLYGNAIRKINDSGAVVVSVDIPSGLFGEDNSGNEPANIVQADYTVSFQFPKLSFLFPENNKYVGEWTVLPIGLHEETIAGMVTPYRLTDNEMIRSLLKKRSKYDHKGVFGHALFVGGSYGRMGAVVMGTRAALRSGAGLVSCFVPGCGVDILQVAVPEAMAVGSSGEAVITDSISTNSFSALGIGPGMGCDRKTVSALGDFLADCRIPVVLDADALNMIAQNRNLLDILPQNAILTPHLKEFERLAGKSDDGFSRLQKQIDFSTEYRCIVVLKGAHTSVSLPDGRVFFNTTGNPGMATGGSGDVLTGIILSLLARHYKPEEAALTGVYLHGLAGDMAKIRWGEESLIATDIIKCMGEAFAKIKNE